MKRTAIVILMILISFAVTDCKKKNYPSDIPKWLKERIDKMEKDSKGIVFSRKRNCKFTIPRTVKEYSDGSSTFYWISDGSANPTGYYIYNYNGQEVCAYSGGYAFPCGNSGYEKNFVRIIWKEECTWRVNIKTIKITPPYSQPPAPNPCTVKTGGLFLFLRFWVNRYCKE